MLEPGVSTQGDAAKALDYYWDLHFRKSPNGGVKRFCCRRRHGLFLLLLFSGFLFIYRLFVRLFRCSLQFLPGVLDLSGRFFSRLARTLLFFFLGRTFFVRTPDGPDDQGGRQGQDENQFFENAHEIAPSY
jgi:hypothetical protein